MVDEPEFVTLTLPDAIALAGVLVRLLRDPTALVQIEPARARLAGVVQLDEIESAVLRIMRGTVELDAAHGNDGGSPGWGYS